MQLHNSDNLKMSINNSTDLKLNIISWIKLVIVCAFLQSLPFILVCQSQNTTTEIISLFDSTQKIYGSNDLLVNGPVYYRPNRLANGTPFLYSSDFINSTVFTEGCSFQGLDLKYDIASQRLILINTMPSGARLQIGLSNVLIDSFLLNDYLFVNPDKLHLTSNYSYMHVLNTGRYRMFIGYNKEFINRYDQKNPNGKYSITQRSLFLASDSTLISINSKKIFVNLFPSTKKAVLTYLRKNKIKLKKANPEQLKQLIEFYNLQLKNTDE